MKKVFFLIILFLTSLSSLYSKVENPDLILIDSIGAFEYGSYYSFDNTFVASADSLNIIRSLTTPFPELSGYVLIQSTDGGKNWNKIYSDTTYEYIQKGEKKAYWANQLINIQYFENKKIILECTSGHRQNGAFIITSNDNGQTWETKKYDSLYAIQFLYWKDIPIFMIKFSKSAGDYPFKQHKYYSSSDGGLSWDIVEFPEEYIEKSYYKLTNIDSNNIFFQIINNPEEPYNIWSYSPMIYKIKEKKWEKLEKLASIIKYPFSPEFRNINDASIVINKTINDSEYYSLILRTKDNWVTIDIIFNMGPFTKYLKRSQLMNIKYFDSLNMIAFGRDYSLVKTTDGGLTWKQLQISYFSKNEYDSLEFNKQNNKAATLQKYIMFSDCIWKSINQIYMSTSGTFSKEGYFYKINNNASDVVEYSINKNDFQIYPNPATDRILLKEIPDGATTYEIYNQLGIKVNEGEITKEINVSTLATGIYFLKIGNEKWVKFVKVK